MNWGKIRRMLLGLLGALVISAMFIVVSSNKVDAKTYDITDGQHIKSVTCKRGDYEKWVWGGNNSATIDFLFGDDHVESVKRDLNTWDSLTKEINCSKWIPDYELVNLKTGKASDFVSMYDYHSSMILPSDHSDSKYFSYYNTNWKQFEEDLPASDVIISVSSSSIQHSAECVVSKISPTSMNPPLDEAVAVTLSDGSQGWSVISSGDGIAAEKDGNTLRIRSIAPTLCPKDAGTGGVSQEVVVGIPGTDVKATITVKISTYTNVLGDDTSEEVGESADVERTPWDKCNVGSGSWILCYIFEFASEAADGAYAFIEDQLEVQSSEVASLDTTNTSNDKTVIATFRDIANVFFIILTLIAIISQLTGFGLSNYNIKRMLPRLLVVAILANLSFYIAQIAVDLSNIFGSQLNGMLGNLVSYKMEDAPSQSLSWVTIVSAIVGMGVASAGWLSIGAVLLAIISGGLGFMLFMGILLLRRVAVLLLIAIAPLAFVCMLLPSTENLFKKWLSMFKVLLVIYPVCGLLMGIGKLTSAIVWNANVASGGGTGGSLTMIVCLALTVIPFFAVVSVTKGSLNALGSIGSKITGALSGARAKITGAALNSRTGQILQNQAINSQRGRRIKSLQSGRNLLGKTRAFRGSYEQLRNRAYLEEDAQHRKDISGFESYLDNIGAGEDGFDKTTEGIRVGGTEGLLRRAVTRSKAGDTDELNGLLTSYAKRNRFNALGRGLESVLGKDDIDNKTATVLRDTFLQNKDFAKDAFYSKGIGKAIESALESDPNGSVSNFNTMMGDDSVAQQMAKMAGDDWNNISKGSLAFLKNYLNSTSAAGAVAKNSLNKVLKNNYTTSQIASAFAGMSNDKAGLFDGSIVDALGADDIVSRMSINDITSKQMSDVAAKVINANKNMITDTVIDALNSKPELKARISNPELKDALQDRGVLGI